MHRNHTGAASAGAPPGQAPTGRAPDGDPWRVFGARLRHWRRRAGLTQAQLGAEIGYDHTAVSKLEHGTRRTSPRIADRLDDLLAAGGELRTACRRTGLSAPRNAAVPGGRARPPLP
ncbi:helix-turn-helix transcriptional regulator, partial [Kitasatospora sp. NPDC047058]|uniref:helix-turn-helix domain-containing protein n=1 Tax=Kitasatospora sp. NPDC047058 TaxID=3155620 RepID=UPI003406CCBE